MNLYQKPTFLEVNLRKKRRPTRSW